MKTTNKALFSSVIALILCCSMLIGSTFAWFTDEATSGVNQIIAGNLDVELYAGNAKVDSTTKLFDDITKWEPGAVAYENLTVANEGNLALKYELSVNFANAVAAPSGKTLADALQVGVVPGGVSGDRDAVLSAVSEWKSLKSFNLYGGLEALKDATYGIVIYWAPSANDNDFNMNNGQATVLSIDLGVHLYATQLENENDAFGKDYDKDAYAVDTSWYVAGETEFVLNSAAELRGLAALVNGGTDSFAGKTVKLGADVNLRNAAWTAIGTWDHSFSGNFDGQGHIISNLYVNDPTGEGVGFFGVVDNVSIENVTLHNVDISGYSMVAGLVGAAYPATISNCHISGNVKIVAEWAYVAGIAGYCYYGTQVDKCSVVAEGTGLIQSVTRNAVGGITAWLLEGNHNVTDCHVKNLNLVGWTNVGGITGFVHYNNIIDGCSVENVTLTKTRADGNPGIGLIAGGWSYHATNAITLSNNTVKNASLNGTHVAYSAYNVLYGSEYGGATTRNFTLLNNNTENITNNLMEVTKITDGIIENNGVKQIYNANGLKSLSGSKISGAYELIADIDLGGAEFKAMSAWYASATFNGNGYTISNAQVVSGDNDNGMEQASIFFVSTNGSLTVSNLILKDITVTTKNIDNGYAAAVVGYCEGALVLENVDVVNAKVTGSKSSGMLVGHLTPAGSLTATYCDVAGSITISSFEANGHYAGEYVGTIAGNTALTECTADVTLGGNLKNSNVGTVYGRKVSGVLKIDGIQLVDAPIAIAPAPLEEDFMFPAGTNAVMYKDMNMSGDAQIVHTENAVLGLSNVTAELDHDVIIRKSAGAIVIENSEFTLIDGAKLISVGEGGDAYQVFMVNVTINGVLMDNTTIWEYVDGISYISIVSEWPNT